MDPVSAMAVASALGNVTSGIIGGAMSAHSSRKIQAHEHRWQEKMRATAYQTTVDDLQKAGLNPALAYSNGGASAGVGSGTASAPAPDTNARLDLVSALTAKKQMENIDKQNELLDEQKNKTKAEKKHIENENEFYKNHGVFPGATTTHTANYSGGWGAISGGQSTTTPVGLNSARNVTNGTEKALKNMPKEKWNSLSKAQKAVFPRHLQQLYNETYSK